MSDLGHLPAVYQEWVASRVEGRRRDGAARHRTIPPPPHRKPRELDGVWYHVCRLCAEPIRKPDGSPDKRRWWHPACVDLYMAATSAQRLRLIVFRRDHGVCAGCGRKCSAPVAADDPQRWRYHWVEAGQPWRDIHPWEADHIDPLIDGGSLELANVQTLCDRCHRAKTAREAAERAYRRRREAARAIGQEELFEL